MRPEMIPPPMIPPDVVRAINSSLTDFITVVSGRLDIMGQRLSDMDARVMALTEALASPASVPRTTNTDIAGVHDAYNRAHEVLTRVLLEKAQQTANTAMMAIVQPVLDSLARIESKVDRLEQRLDAVERRE